MSLSELLKKPREAKKIVDCSTIDNDTWLDYRRKAIGGSDSASILGISKWRTPLQLYYDKLGLSDNEEIDEQREYIFDFGHAMEEFVAIYYEKVFNRKFKDALELKFSIHYGTDIRVEKCHVYRDTWMYESPENPFMRADLDFKVDLTLSTGETVTGIFECKTTSPFQIQENWESAPPKYYECQTRHYMAVMDVPFAIIACAADNNVNNYYSHVIFRDFDKEKELIDAEREFWWGVENKIPPYEMGINNLDVLTSHIGNTAEDNVTVDNSDFVKNKIADINAYKDNISALNAQVKRLEEKRDILMSDLLTYMASNDRLNISTKMGDKEYQISILSSIRRKTDYKEIFKEFSNTFPNISEQMEEIKEKHITVDKKDKLSIKEKKVFHKTKKAKTA